jgi:polyribonucleotide nucleotidyltransferase
MQKRTFSTPFGAHELTVEFTDLADQAHGSVLLRYGNTVVLVTAVMSDTTRDGLDYFPLTVDYEERFYAAGAILGSRFMRREGRPSEEAILSGRIIDRTIRPLFDHRMRNEVQVVTTILSVDDMSPDILGVVGASLALATSPIPWNGPVGGLRIGMRKDGTAVINPTYAERADPQMAGEILACGKNGTINMIELGAREASEEQVAAALALAAEQITQLQAFQETVIAQISPTKKSVLLSEYPEALHEVFEEHVAPKVAHAVFSGEPGKGAIGALKKEWLAIAAETLPDVPGSSAARFYEDAVDAALHQGAIVENKRPDGRAMDEVRPLFAQAGGISPVAHGTGIFYRGGTHVFSALTLGGPGDSQLIDSMESPDTTKRFMHHYNFPPFAPGETGRIGGMNRRMVGHGALAEKSLEAVIPPKEVFPYTIRLVSECFASNGSTSMASVCASTVALMDGGVPITRPVAGIAMGLMMNDSGYRILTDIQGPEDHHGDMDFKVAGTAVGITGIQLDVKVDGIPLSILREALTQARTARLHILTTITNAIAAPRADISPRAPKILTLSIKKDQIGLVIGPGGKTINGIREETGVDDITIEEDGTVFITGRNGSAELARDAIHGLTRTYEPGDRFEGEVVRILDFGAFVKISKTAEGLVHISEIAPYRVERVRDILTEGDLVPVVVKEVDEKGRINLSIKRVDPTFAERKQPASKPLGE